MLPKISIDLMPPEKLTDFTRVALMVQDRRTRKIVKIACVHIGGEIGWIAENEIRFPRADYRIVVGIVSVLGELLGCEVGAEDETQLPKAQGRA